MMLQESVSIDRKPDAPDLLEQDQKLKYMAVRLRRFADAEVAFSASPAYKLPRKLIATRVERRDPALRNLSEGLESCGMQIRVDGCPLYWLLVEDDNSCRYYLEKNEVECVFPAQQFEEFKKSIRYLQGAHYVDKCMALAEQFPIKDQQRHIRYNMD